MPRVELEGQVFDIPAGTLPGELRRLAGVPADDVLYTVGAPGEKPRVIDDAAPVQLRDGEQVGRIRPFVAGG